MRLRSLHNLLTCSLATILDRAHATGPPTKACSSSFIFEPLAFSLLQFKAPSYVWFGFLTRIQYSSYYAIPPVGVNAPGEDPIWVGKKQHCAMWAFASRHDRAQSRPRSCVTLRADRNIVIKPWWRIFLRHTKR